MISMFKEGVGKSQPFSMRRFLAFFLAVSAAWLFNKGDQFYFYGGCACLVASCVYMLCTTAADLTSIINAAKDLKNDRA